MRISNLGKALFVGACILAGTASWSQQKATAPMVSTDVAATFAVEKSQVIPSDCCFWFKGGGLDAAITFKNRIGVAVALTADHASNVTTGVDADKWAVMGGPRYTWTIVPKKSSSGARYQVFAQALLGGVHGFDGSYPALPTIQSSANGVAAQLGGGMNYLWNRNWGIRLFEADFVRTGLPNNAGDVQHDFRLSFGITYHH